MVEIFTLGKLANSIARAEALSESESPGGREWVQVVDMSMAISRITMPQTRGNWESLPLVLL